MTPLLALFAIALLVGTVLVVSAKTVGQIAEEYGEDPARWKAAMLPFGIFGPFIARAMLDRRNGRGGPRGYV